MAIKQIPEIFFQLQSEEYIKEEDILKTQDGFYFVYKSLADILLEKGITDFPIYGGKRLLCSNFFDDWFLYAVPDEFEHVYGLLKLREQEHDAQGGILADGDTPGVTISFVSFECERLMECLENPSDENRMKLDDEINRVVAKRGQKHHEAIKRYFVNPKSEGSYLMADAYIRKISSFAKNGYIDVPERYKEIVKRCSKGEKGKLTKLPELVEKLNLESGRLICDNEKIYIENPKEPTESEALAILMTHTGNSSFYSFAAEVEYHARFLMPIARIKIPLLGRSVYDSAIRADMTVGETEMEGPAPFYDPESKIVKRQYALHQKMIF